MSDFTSSLPVSPFVQGRFRSHEMYGMTCTESERFLTTLVNICGDDDLGDVTFVATIPAGDFAEVGDEDDFSFIDQAGDIMARRARGVVWMVNKHNETITFESTSAAQTAKLLSILVGETGHGGGGLDGLDTKRLGTALRRKRSDKVNAVLRARYAEQSASEALDA